MRNQRCGCAFTYDVPEACVHVVRVLYPSGITVPCDVDPSLPAWPSSSHGRRQLSRGSAPSTTDSLLLHRRSARPLAERRSCPVKSLAGSTCLQQGGIRPGREWWSTTARRRVDAWVAVVSCRWSKVGCHGDHDFLIPPFQLLCPCWCRRTSVSRGFRRCFL